MAPAAINGVTAMAPAAISSVTARAPSGKGLAAGAPSGNSLAAGAGWLISEGTEGETCVSILGRHSSFLGGAKRSQGIDKRLVKRIEHYVFGEDLGE